MRKRIESKRKDKRQRLLQKLACTDDLLIDAFMVESHAAVEQLLHHQTYPDFPFFVANSDDNLKFVDATSGTASLDIDWHYIDSSINPLSGELNEDRSERKRSQISCLVQIIEYELSVLIATRPIGVSGPITIVDFGAGSGHLGNLNVIYTELL
jgi:hypothetical protein